MLQFIYCEFHQLFVYYSIMKRKENMSNNVSKVFDDLNEELNLGLDLSTDNDKCSKCGKIPAKIEYKNKQYCTWYCAKKDK